MTIDGSSVQWLVTHGLILVIGLAILLVVYRASLSAIHRLVPTLITAQATSLRPEAASPEEVAKRALTIEDLLTKLLRVVVLSLIVALVLAVLDLWTLLAGIAVILVAVVFATKDVVLDYVVGLLIFIEGPFFKGDYVVVPGHPGIEGVVEEVGLRRTVLRDGIGAAHAVSNGYIRLSSNRTRLFSVAVADVVVLHAADLDRAIGVMRAVTEARRDDADWADKVDADASVDVSVNAIGLDGAAVRTQVPVRTGMQGPVASELRRRLANAFVKEGIATGRWDTPMPIVTSTQGGQ
jgi:small conductance mechanosensitive channel